MAHPAQQQFFEDTTARFKHLCEGASKILEVGSQNINGSVRQYFPSASEYLGIDIGPGVDVDWVVPGELIQLPASWADLVLTTECLEHCAAWEKVFLNMIRILKPAGLFLMTCASFGRGAHGTLDSDEFSSPYTQDYYRNLGAADIAEKIKLGLFFDKHSFEYDAISGDLYFWGIRSSNPFHESLVSWLSPLDRLARAQGQLGQAVSRHAQLSAELRNALVAMENANLERESLVRRVEALDATIGSLQNSNNELRQELDHQRHSSHHYQQACSDYSARLASLELELSLYRSTGEGSPFSEVAKRIRHLRSVMS